ncbi:MAG: 4Fe-4S dicluster domain-containing protein [bacterium]|nr:4Fe-4S dicluster domain-containing protein [bacterium]
MRRGEPAVARLLAENELDSILARVAERNALWVPAGDGEQSAFALYRPGLALRQEAGPTRRTAKEIFFPRTEILFTYGEDDGPPRLEAPPAEVLPAVVYGLRPCDARALTMLDPVFEDPGYPDGLWGGRRRGATLVGVGCTRPSRACFCTSVGGDPAGEEGLDVLVVPIPGHYLARAVTDRGEEWLQALDLPRAGPDHEAAAVRAAAAGAGLAVVDTEGLPAKLERMFGHAVWEQLHERCLGCAACTYLCPTCHCFDIVDEGGSRLRNWDSCMFPLFTLHASGHNPRLSGKERMRQRIMHKFSYYPQRQGRPACVGCGRCVEVCPVNLDLRSVLAQLKGVEA